jgi:hypothetical protein
LFWNCVSVLFKPAISYLDPSAEEGRHEIKFPNKWRKKKINKFARILLLTALLPISALIVLPNVHASTPIFTISQANGAYGSCGSACAYTNNQVSNYAVNNVQYDNYGDSAGSISTNNNDYPNLQIYYFHTFVYNPSSQTDLFLYLTYSVNAYVFSPSGGSIPAWIEGGYMVASGAVSQYQNLNSLVVACGGRPCTFEFDGAGGSSALCSPCITTVNNPNGYLAQSIPSTYGQCPGSFCPYVTGATYTFVLYFQITANPRQYVTQNNGGSPGSGPAYINAGNCLVLSYANAPYYGCPPSPDFSISASSFTVNPGQSGTSEVTITGSNGFQGQVSFTDSVPAGLSCGAISPSSLAIPPNPNYATISCSSNTPGTYTVGVTGTIGSITHSTSFTATILTPPQFTLSANPSSISMNQYTCWPSTVTVSSLNGFSGTVTLQASTSLAASFSGCWGAAGPTTVSVSPSTPGTATLTFNSCSAAAGSYPTTVTGTSSSPSYTTQTSISVTVLSYSSTCQGSGGGSLAQGTSITMADGSTVAVQNLKVGDQMLGYDPVTGQYQIATVTSIVTKQATNMLVIHTATGLPLRVDASQTEVLWTRHPDGTTLWLPAPMLAVGDDLWAQSGWVSVTNISYAPAGNHTMYDITATVPYFANGYLDPMHPS